LPKGLLAMGNLTVVAAAVAEALEVTARLVKKKIFFGVAG